MTSTKRFEQLIASYGSDITRWPPSERSFANRLLHESAAARTLMEQYRTLDTLLDTYTVPPLDSMQRRILNNVSSITRSSGLDRILDWIFPHSGHLSTWAWRPALLACLPLVCGIYMANFYSFGIDSIENSWQEELYLISMSDYAEISE